MTAQLLFVCLTTTQQLVNKLLEWSSTNLIKCNSCKCTERRFSPSEGEKRRPEMRLLFAGYASRGIIIITIIITTRASNRYDFKR